MLQEVNCGRNDWCSCTEDGAVASYPCAIELTDNAWLHKYNYYDSCYFGILYQNQNLDAALQFADFLLNYND